MGREIKINNYKTVTTDKEKIKGLMFSKRVDKRLIFIFSNDVNFAFHSFFCPNFDIIFLNSKKEVIYFESVKKPKIIKCNRKYKYVIEAELGFVEKNRIKKGDKIRW